ncbi:MAG: S24/S26 family peptidase [Tannerella sp.]|nr:S24/S26 family peptidase [Tannerella sp.]
MEITQEWLFEETKVFLAEGKKVILRVKGNSMNPYLRTGKDVVVLSPVVGDEDLQTGVIVLFTYRDRYILHRIIGRQGDKYVIRGDGVCKGKEIVPRNDILAVVHSVIRPGGKEVFVESRSARFYLLLWRALYPVRKPLLLFLRYVIKRK